MKNTLFILIFLTTSACANAQSDTPNAIYAGMGLGRNFSVNHTEFALMAGYDRHFPGTPEFTLGLLLEGVFSEHSGIVIGAPLGFYPLEVLKMWVAPCYQFAGGGTEYYTDDIDNVEYFKNDNEFVLKFGAGYNYHFHNSHWAVLPFIEGSIIRSQFGLTLGAKFNLYF